MKQISMGVLHKKIINSEGYKRGYKQGQQDLIKEIEKKHDYLFFNEAWLEIKEKLKAKVK